MLWDQLLKFYKTLLSESLMIRKQMVEVTTMEGITTEEVKITVEAITKVETMQIMIMVMEIVYLIAETLAEVLEGVDYFLIRLRLG